MTRASSLGTPEPWNLVADAYVNDLQPLFARYGRDALILADPPAGAEVLDVATGPGTLAIDAAQAGYQVTAVDFSEAMLTRLRRACTERGISGMDIRQADGHDLPFEARSFDCAFSMFGLMFFPDRAAGIRELRRVLRPGGRAVISSWARADQVPLLAALGAALRDLAPGGGGSVADLPLADPDELRRELSDGGFRDVGVRQIEHAVQVSSVRQFWEANERSSAPVALLRRSVESGAWRRIATDVVARVEGEVGRGPHTLLLPALLAVGTR